jgi:hypothetical protein
MPLVPGKSKAAISENIATERKSGRPEKQAIAIAMSEAGMEKKKKRKNTLEAAYKKHMGGSEETGETKKESKKTEMGEM